MVHYALQNRILGELDKQSKKDKHCALFVFLTLRVQLALYFARLSLSLSIQTSSLINESSHSGPADGVASYGVPLRLFIFLRAAVFNRQCPRRKPLCTPKGWPCLCTKRGSLERFPAVCKQRLGCPDGEGWYVPFFLFFFCHSFRSVTFLKESAE